VLLLKESINKTAKKLGLKKSTAKIIVKKARQLL
jgi:hypothetical protein